MSKGNQERYDVIVVGSGIGGLTAGGLLAAAGCSVLVLERHDRPGGYAHGFRRKRYHFDSAVHLTSGCGPHGYPGGQIIHKILKALGVRDSIDFIPVNPFAVVVYPGIRTTLPQTIDAFIHSMAIRFPSQVAGLSQLIGLSLQLSQEIASADEILAQGGGSGMQTELPALLRYRRSTLADVCSEFVQDRKLIAILAANWPYLGLPPSRVSFVYWSVMFIGYLEDGACYCRGGFQRLADGLVRGLENSEGTIRYKSDVERICMVDGQVAGVQLKSGQVVTTSCVIANSDMRHTIYSLVGKEYFPERFLRRIERMRPSLSIFAVYIATNLGLDRFNAGHELFCYKDFDHDRNYRNSCNGEITWIGISVPSLTDDSLVSKGEHLVMLTALVPYRINRSWARAKTGYMDKMLEMADAYLPGLKNHLLYIEGGSPKTMERFTQNYQGAAYGWDVSPNQVGPHRIQNRSPVEGLFFAGHWTTPGGGIYGAAVSGMQAAKMVLGIADQSEFWTMFDPDLKSLEKDAEFREPRSI